VRARVADGVPMAGERRYVPISARHSSFMLSAVVICTGARAALAAAPCASAETSASATLEQAAGPTIAGHSECEKEYLGQHRREHASPGLEERDEPSGSSLRDDGA